MEQLVILLLIALISIINWIVQKSKERREASKLEKRADSTGENLKGGLAEPPATEAENAMRRLREALGLPEEAEPPTLPRRVEQPASAPPERPPPALPRPAKKPAVLHTPTVHHLEHHKFEFPHRLGKPVVKTEAPKPPSRVRELLRSAGGLRDAVVLSEILGSPKGLRERQFPS